MKIVLTYEDTYYLNVRPVPVEDAKRYLMQLLYKWAGEWLDGEQDDDLFEFEEVTE